MNAFGVGYLSGEIASAGDGIVDAIRRLENRPPEAYLRKELSYRDQKFKALYNQGKLLPKYDWNDQKFLASKQAFITQWFEQHPEVKPGTRKFKKQHVGKLKAEDTLAKMAWKGRIAPDEYLMLFQGIYSV